MHFSRPNRRLYSIRENNIELILGIVATDARVKKKDWFSSFAYAIILGSEYTKYQGLQTCTCDTQVWTVERF